MPESWDRHLLPAGPWQHPRGAMHGLANGEIRVKAGDMDVFQSADGPDSIYPDGLTTDEALRQLDDLAKGQPAKRLSTAFDSVTLYGEDPADRPDVFGKVGNAGVSICTLDDAKRLYSGFDLCAPTTSLFRRDIISPVLVLVKKRMLIRCICA